MTSEGFRNVSVPLLQEKYDLVAELAQRRGVKTSQYIRMVVYQHLRDLTESVTVTTKTFS